MIDVDPLDADVGTDAPWWRCLPWVYIPSAGSCGIPPSSAAPTCTCTPISSLDRAIGRVVVDHHAHQVAVQHVNQRIAADDQVDRIPVLGDELRQRRRCRRCWKADRLPARPPCGSPGRAGRGTGGPSPRSSAPCSGCRRRYRTGTRAWRTYCGRHGVGTTTLR